MTEPLRLKPPGKMDPLELSKFVREKAYKSSPLYAQDYARFRKAELYNQNDQWLQRAYTTGDSRFAMQWRSVFQEADAPDAIPLPVYNEGTPLLENEAARLGRPEYKPRVRAKGENPSLQAREGAQGAERALTSRLKAMPWDVEQDKMTLHMPLYGGTWLLSQWDQTWMDVVRVPAPSLSCPGAPQQPSQPEMPPVVPGQPVTPADPTAPAFAEHAPVPPMPMSVVPCDFKCRKDQAPAHGCCPRCGQALQPYEPTLEEAGGELGENQPKGDWSLQVVSPYRVFPRDAGIGLDRTDVPEWAELHIESLDWVAERYPDKMRNREGQELIRGQSAAELMALDPTLGSPDLLRHSASSGVLKENVLIAEYHKKPWFEYDPDRKAFARNQGRSIVIAVQKDNTDVVCLDSTLMVESLNRPGTYVARKRLEFVPWEMRDGGRRSTVGQSLWDRLFDPQDGINERQSQIRAVNQRLAVPLYIQKKGANFETAAADSALPARRVQYEVDPSDPRPPLELVNNATIDGGVYQERDRDFDTMQRIAGAVEVEKGQVPTGVSAATAIAYLKTEAGEKRRPRILRIRQALVRAWEHGLSLMAALYIEPRPYSFEDETGEERWAFIHGDVIAQASPKVDIYPTPDFDVSDARRETVRDLIRLGVIRPNESSRLNRQVLKAIDPTLDFFLDDDLQEDQAQREWQHYKDQQRVPVIDPSLDDADTHYQEHGRACFSPFFRQKEDEGQWDQALAILGSQWDEAMLQIGLATPPGTSLQTAILGYWRMVLQQAQFPVNPALEFVLGWRAHMEAHKVAKIVAAAKAQPTVAAPATGSAPTPVQEGGAPVQPQPMAPMPAAVQ